MLVGDKADSQIYVNSKLKSAADEGMNATLVASCRPRPRSKRFWHSSRRLNADPDVDGILVQAPLPERLGTAALQRVFDAIDPAKDVDGVTPVNVGRLVQNRADLVACTPAGIIELLEAQRHRYRRQARGRHRPQRHRRQAGLAASAAPHATVTICHSRTRDLPAIAATADILIAATRPAGIRPAIVCQARRDGRRRRASTWSRMPTSRTRCFTKGTRAAGLFERKGSVLVGDVHPGGAEVAGAMTPVPGGVGPLTIAMLMANTLKAAELAIVQRRSSPIVRSGRSSC